MGPGGAEAIMLRLQPLKRVRSGNGGLQFPQGAPYMKNPGAGPGYTAFGLS